MKLPIGFVICKQCRRTYDSRLWPLCPSPKCRAHRGEPLETPPSVDGGAP